MKLEFTPRAVEDLSRIGARSRRIFGPSVALALETYIRATIARIVVMPESGQRIPRRPNVRVMPLGRYPFKIFYTATGETVTILHVRHAARRPWDGDA
jgi:toxin ParE1/3/4